MLRLHRPIGGRMTFLSLPWVIGPVPIVATIWAAYTCGIVVAKKTGDNGKAFMAALLLPSGLVSVAQQLFLSDRNFAVLLISSQIVSSAFFLFILNISKSPGASQVNLGERPPTFSRQFMILSVSYILFNVILSIFPGPDRCTIAKCFVMEWVLGRIDHVFSRLYLETMFGTILLTGIVSHLFRLFMKSRRNGFSN
uniref:Uncharacterized protein n=1 Tax=Rhizobium leguminosarum TaxID=384 RepID=A0A154IET0_RHILE|nr:hypothetical protein A4A59_25610 [Rhizobium leguminosarum]